MAKKIRRGQKVLRSKREITIPYVHRKLIVCSVCGNMGFTPFMKTIGNENIEYCKCVQCGKEFLCEWWERREPKKIKADKEPNEHGEESLESTITDCEDGCKIK